MVLSPAFGLYENFSHKPKVCLKTRKIFFFNPQILQITRITPDIMKDDAQLMEFNSPQRLLCRATINLDKPVNGE